MGLTKRQNTKIASCFLREQWRRINHEHFPTELVNCMMFWWLFPLVYTSFDHFYNGFHSVEKYVSLQIYRIYNITCSCIIPVKSAFIFVTQNTSVKVYHIVSRWCAVWRRLQGSFDCHAYCGVTVVLFDAVYITIGGMLKICIRVYCNMRRNINVLDSFCCISSFRMH